MPAVSATNMDDLMEQLDEVLESSFKMPGKRVVVDVEKVRAIIDDMRMTMPTEVKQAKGYPWGRRI